MHKFSTQKHRNLLSAIPLILLLIVLVSFTKQDEPKENEIIRLRIIGMSDLHGNFLPYDHLQRRPATGGLPWVYSFVRQERKDATQQIVFLNSGDMLQGSMAAYYYTYLDKRDQFMPAVFMGRTGVDATVFGNHDLEPGQLAMIEFNRVGNEQNSAVLSANVVFRGSNRRFMRPYSIVERDGLRIAILGLTSPILTQCAKTQITAGLDVLEMLESARYWMDRLHATEDPDMVIGLFHAGFANKNSDTASHCFKVNDPLYIAEHVPGFDGFILGHTHQLKIDSIQVNGRQIFLVEPGVGGRHVGILDFEIQRNSDETFTILRSSAKLENVSENQQLCQDILDEFAEEEAIIAKAAGELVVYFKDTINSVDSYFGSNFFSDIVHKVQLALDTAADVSFASPLSAKIMLTPAYLTFADLLRIYRFENKLVPLRMTGGEIKGYLEYSYGLWVNQMLTPNDNLLRLADPSSPFLFVTPAFNFDSGAGLDYEVDVTKPVGERITILRLWNDKPFHEDSVYRVIANSYRAAGAGGHMEIGAGLNPRNLQRRIIQFPTNIEERELYSTQVRELIRRNFIQQEELGDFRYDNWRFVPENFVVPAKEREREILLQRMK